MTIYAIVDDTTDWPLSADPRPETVLTDDPLRHWRRRTALYVVEKVSRRVQLVRKVDPGSPEADDPCVRCCLAASVRSRDCGANIEWADLAGADLSGASLADADLRAIDLRGVNLSGADLSGADLSWSDLAGANLTDAILRSAILRSASFVGAVLREAWLVHANIRGADLTGADLTGAIWPSAIPPGWRADAHGRLRRQEEEEA